METLEKQRLEITDEWLDSKFKQLYPSSTLTRILRERVWNIPGPLNIKGKNGWYDFFTTVPHDEYNSDETLFRVKYQDQLLRWIELMEDLEKD